MLLISSTIKNIFQRVFLLLMIIEIIILIVILIVYRVNILKVSEDVNQNRKQVVIKYRDIFDLYLKNKYTLLIDDLLIIMQAYDGVEEWKKNKVNNNFFEKYNNNTFIEETCAIQGTQIQNIKENSQNWYDNSIILYRRLKATWYYGQNIIATDLLQYEDKQKLVNLCVMNSILGGMTRKHLKWMDYISGTMDFYTFIWKNSFFVKFPLYYNVYMQPNWVDPTPIANCISRRPGEYDPLCRPSFDESMKDDSKIVVIKPYKMASTNYYGSDICVKSYSTSLVDGRDTPDLLTCIKFSFNDIQIYRDQIEQALGRNKKIFIVYFDGIDFSVLFDSEKAPEDFKSYGKLLGMNKNPENLFFESYYQNKFENILNNNNTDSNADLNKLKSFYPEFLQYYQNNIHSKLINMAENYNKNYNINPNVTINLTNYKTYPESQYFFNLTKTFEYSSQNNSYIVSENIVEDFFFFPITVSFSYDEKYQLTMKKKSKFYFLFVDVQNTRYENVSLFFSLVSQEIFLYFFLLIGINFFIWVIFGMFYFYFSKGFFKPLKIINNFYKDLFLMNRERLKNAKDENISIKNTDINNLKTFSSKKKGKIEQIISKWIF